jgi:DivIVA domain-containing protein
MDGESMTGRRGFRAPGQEPQPAFSLAMRGYDRRQVDQYLSDLSDDRSLAVPAFRQVMRGYNVDEVDMHIAELKARPGK